MDDCLPNPAWLAALGLSSDYDIPGDGSLPGSDAGYV